MATSKHIRQSQPPDAALDVLMDQAHAMIAGALNQELQLLGMTVAQHVVIVNLANSRSESIAALCKMLAYDPGAMTRMITRLERKGLVTRLRTSGNNRAITLELTAAGLQIYPKLVDSVSRVLNRLMAGFTPAETRKLKKLLHKLLSTI